jgi:phage tail sheath protein FI
VSDVLTFPGVYIREIPSGVRPINGVSTSVTAFVGRARRGPVDDPVQVSSFADYERRFGGLWAESRMSFAVQQYFLNGGRTAVIVRVHNPGGAVNDGTASAQLPGPAGNLDVEAANPGEWGEAVRATVTPRVRQARSSPDPQRVRGPLRRGAAVSRAVRIDRVVRGAGAPPAPSPDGARGHGGAPARREASGHAGSRPDGLDQALTAALAARLPAAGARAGLPAEAVAAQVATRIASAVRRDRR